LLEIGRKIVAIAICLGQIYTAKGKGKKTQWLGFYFFLAMAGNLFIITQACSYLEILSSNFDK